MKLRDHPLVNYRGARNWPPVWTIARNGIFKTVKGEVGVLRYVYTAEGGISNKCFLLIHYQSEAYTGCMIFQDYSFCTQIAQFLRDHIGRPIKEIGDLDLSSTL